MRTKVKWTILCSAVAVAISAAVCPVLAQVTNTNSLRFPTGPLNSIERVDRIIGKDVHNGNGQPIGRIEDLMVDLESGRALYAIVSAGGFLGVAHRLITVPPGAFTSHDGKWRLNTDKKILMQAPQYFDAEDKQAEMESPAFASRVYKYFGQRTWWETGAAGGAPSQFVNVDKANALIVRDIQNLAGQTIAKVDNLMIDFPAGRVPYVILAPDRNLNLEMDNLYALPPSALTRSADRKSLSTSVDKDKLAGAPHFEKSNWPDMSAPEWAGRIYQFFGKQAYFEDGTLQPTSRRTNTPERIYHEPVKLRK
jgi:sporulation protein YlmC with PRC-barrel domain